MPPATLKIDPQYIASAPSSFTAGCDRENIGGTLYVNAEVEPWLTNHPSKRNRMGTSGGLIGKHAEEIVTRLKQLQQHRDTGQCNWVDGRCVDPAGTTSVANGTWAAGNRVP